MALPMRTLLLGLALTLAACDSAAPGPIAPEPPDTPSGPAAPPAGPPQFTVRGLPAQLTYEAGETDTFSITAFFEPNLPADIVVTPSSPSTLVNLETNGRVLTIKALESGTSALVLRASASGYRDTTLSIPLTVSGSICPRRGDRDVLAIQTGDAWRFAYRDENVPSGAVTEGVLTWRFLNMTCGGGGRQWIVQYDLDAVRTVAGTGERVVQRGSISLSESSSNLVLLNTNVYQNITNTARFQRFWTGPDDSAVLQTDVPCTGLNSPPAEGSMTFRVGVGLVSEVASCGSGATLHRRTLERML